MSTCARLIAHEIASRAVPRPVDRVLERISDLAQTAAFISSSSVSPSFLSPSSMTWVPRS